MLKQGFLGNSFPIAANCEVGRKLWWRTTRRVRETGFIGWKFWAFPWIVYLGIHPATCPEEVNKA